MFLVEVSNLKINNDIKTSMNNAELISFEYNSEY